MLDELGPRELGKRWEQARRFIHDNGVSHNVYGDPDGLDRPWSLDLIPLLIPSEQWDRLSEGLSAARASAGSAAGRSLRAGAKRC